MICLIDLGMSCYSANTAGDHERTVLGRAAPNRMMRRRGQRRK
jgi:hypothetical protein